MRKLFEAVRALGKFMIDRALNRRSENVVTEHVYECDQHHPRMCAELKPYLTRRGTQVVHAEPLRALEDEGHVDEITSPEVLAIEGYLDSLKMGTVDYHEAQSLSMRAADELKPYLARGGPATVEMTFDRRQR